MTRPISVVINTYNRAQSLPNTLDGLRAQQYRDFEVVVVNGPSSDGTDTLVRERPEPIRLVDCPEVRLGVSRNLGIEASAGELVAFIDDDAIPEPDWLLCLNDAFDDEEVAGAGGLVIDHTGYDLQYLYSTSDRWARTEFSDYPPLEAYSTPGAGRFVYLQGTNNCYRRDVLIDVGGFDEEIEYFLDETELCMQIVDGGWKLVQLLGGAVHHKYLASHLRKSSGAFTHPYAPVKNRTYFCLKNARDGQLLDAMDHLTRDVLGVRAAGEAAFTMGTFDETERDHFLQQVDAGFADGIDRGLHGERRSRTSWGSQPTMTPFLADRHERHDRRVCMISEDYPPRPVGGVGRYTVDIARTLAERGDEVHVVTYSRDVSRLDFEDGVWVHRIAPPPVGAFGSDHPIVHNLVHSAAMYHAVRALHDRRPLDVVHSAIWNCEGFFTVFDSDLAAIVTLVTSMAKVVQLTPAWESNLHAVAVRELESIELANAPEIHAISKAIWRENLGRLGRGNVRLAELGVADVAPKLVADPSAEGHVTILFVGRLEIRKGVDTFLRAALRVAAAHPDVRVRLVGADGVHVEGRLAPQEQFASMTHDHPELRDQFEFSGPVSEDELLEAYQGAQVLCVPSLYESFGLVVLEGMRAGLPVVAASVGGMVETMSAAEQPTFASGDADGLAAVLERLVTDSDERVRLGRRARQSFEQRWNLDAAVDRFEEMVAAASCAHRRAGGLDRPRVIEALRPLLGVDAEPFVSRLLDPERFGLDRVPRRLSVARNAGGGR